MPTERTYIDKTLRHEARTYREDKVCGKCGRGRLRPAKEPEGNKTLHACTHCKREVLVEGDPYPRMVTEYEQAGPAI